MTRAEGMTGDLRSDPQAAARHSRPGGLLVLLSALSIQGLSGLVGGLGLVLDPTGASIGLPVEWLAGSPFTDFLVPGLVLFTVLGIAPLAAAHGAWKRRTWSWAACLAVGVALLVWLAVEVAVIGYQSQPPLQLVYGLVGGAIVVTALLPSVRDDLAPGTTT